uniref:Uncharacterized protein n=1 Tax=Fagus sylvatica TaxID=28930 RepID=A0A2N9H851_FAGSY
MAGKNAKKATSSKIPPNKLPEIKPEPITPSQLVRYNPQQASSQNNPSSSRMVSLGKPVQYSSSFAKALTESYDPFNKKIVPATPAAPTKQRNNKKAVSPYFLLFDEKLFPIEFEHRRIEDPLLLIKSYFPPHPTDGVQQHYCPSVPYKTIHFYQNILQQEGSVEIKSIFGKTPETKNQLLFHKVEDQLSSSIPDLLKGKSPEELAEICKLATQACQAASAFASGKGKSLASSEGSTTEMINLSQFSAPVKKNWYEESLFQDAQDPYAGIEEDEALIEEQYLG